VTPAELEALLRQVRGIKSTTAPNVKRERVIRSARNRKRGEDTVMSKYYICSLFDMTTKIVYVCGGRGYTENLVDNLLKEEHELHTFDTKRYGETQYQVISYNKRTSYGLRLEDFTGWKEIRVLRGSGDFHFMLHNHKGRGRVIK
jgi:hypothetical protein